MPLFRDPPTPPLLVAGLVVVGGVAAAGALALVGCAAALAVCAHELYSIRRSPYWAGMTKSAEAAVNVGDAVKLITDDFGKMRSSVELAKFGASILDRVEGRSKPIESKPDGAEAPATPAGATSEIAEMMAQPATRTPPVQVSTPPSDGTT